MELPESDRTQNEVGHLAWILPQLRRGLQLLAAPPGRTTRVPAIARSCVQ